MVLKESYLFDIFGGSGFDEEFRSDGSTDPDRLIVDAALLQAVEVEVDDVWKEDAVISDVLEVANLASGDRSASDLLPGEADRQAG